MDDALISGIDGATKAIWDGFRRAARQSAMDDLIQATNFIVTLNEFVFGFQSVSGISVSKKVDYIEEGGVNDHRIMVGCPSDDNPTLTFKRGYMMRRNTLLDTAVRAAAAAIPISMLRKGALIAASALDAQSALEEGPALGMIYVFNREKDLKAMYSFLSLGMTSWRLDDLDAVGTGILCEEFTVAHQGLTRHSIGAPSLAYTIRDGINHWDNMDQEDQRLEEEAKARADLKKKLEEQKKAEEEYKKLLQEKNSEIAEKTKQAEEERKKKGKEYKEKLETAKAEQDKALEERKAKEVEDKKQKEEERAERVQSEKEVNDAAKKELKAKQEAVSDAKKTQEEKEKAAEEERKKKGEEYKEKLDAAKKQDNQT